ncbi:RidA family protein [Metabacillus sp. GX 13764]|uniref:RidA family protein n=1 Tax=Metabacillus kandeliae TaxID=2900151 RepID=UPI001E29FEA2|nr:RidA family protein [Metabacillus kandeliae]MCD7034295.1 RidA family protein [Metabacillus kandeliae]
MNNIKTYNHDLWDHGISQGYRVDHTIYISGQFSHNEKGNFIGEADIKTQTEQTLKNLDHVLKGFGVTKFNLAYVEIYLTQPPAHAEEVINMFKAYVDTHRPAGSLIGANHLAFPGQLIEIAAIAHSS